MLKNLICLNFLILTELSINIAVFALHNKILLWRGNISIFFALLELCKFNHRFLFNFGVTVFYTLLISLTSSLHLYCMIKHLLNSFFTSFQIILISRSLALMFCLNHCSYKNQILSKGKEMCFSGLSLQC